MRPVNPKSLTQRSLVLIRKEPRTVKELMEALPASRWTVQKIVFRLADKGMARWERDRVAGPDYHKSRKVVADDWYLKIAG